jgi:hypothetical protein
VRSDEIWSGRIIADSDPYLWKSYVRRGWVVCKGVCNRWCRRGGAGGGQDWVERVQEVRARGAQNGRSVANGSRGMIWSRLCVGGGARWWCSCMGH